MPALTWRRCAATLAAALALGGCGDDSPAAPPAAPPAPANLDAFFSAVPEWSTFSPLLPASNVATGSPSDLGTMLIDDDPYTCTVTPYSLANTPDKVVTLNPDVEVLWVGSLLQGNGYRGGIGSLAELPIRQRAALDVTINLLADDTRRTVTDPTVATVTQAIGELVSSAAAAGHRAGSNIEYRSEVTHSVVQAMIKMGLSANYSGANIRAELGASINTEKRTVTAYFAQQMFTVSMVLPQRPQDVFSDAFTEDVLADQVGRGRMGPSNPPVFVSSVTYGRILMFTFTSTSTEAKINQTLNAMYDKMELGGELSSELRTVLDNAEIRVITVGGDAENALALIRNNNLAEYFAADAPLTTARPISYTVRNLKDNVTAQVSETTDYNLQQCAPSTLVATGAEYEIWPDRLRAVELRTPLGFKRTALMHWQLYVRHSLGSDSLADRGTAALNVKLSTPMAEGDVIYFRDYGDVKTTRVKLRFDGSNSVIVPVGTFTDLSFTVPRIYTFELGAGNQAPLMYRWGGRNMADHDHIVDQSITRIFEDSNVRGTARFQIYWKYRRVGLTYD